MKTTTQILWMTMLIVAAIFTGCKKDDDDEITLSADDAADVIEYALAASTQGISAQTGDVIDAYDIAATGKTDEFAMMACGVTYDSTVTRTGSVAQISYDYVFRWDYTLTCNAFSVPQSFAFNYTADGTYNALRMSSADSATARLTITGVQPSAQSYVFNGTYARAGSQTSKVRNQNSFASTIQINLANVNVSKSTEEIESGSADVTVSGQATGGKSFTFTGAIVFNGDGTATLTINGTDYNIQL